MTQALAQRYANALYLLTEKRGVTKAVEADLLALSQLLAAKPEFGTALSSPLHSRKFKEEWLQRVFGSRAQAETAHLLGLLARNGRAGLLGEVAKAFVERLKVLRGIQSATVISAQPLDANQLAEVEKRLSAQYPGRTFEWSVQVDPSLVAGFKIRIGDRVLDYSLSLKLKELEKQLMAKA
jgi:F-type H+-transporting ATPase subunit delta